jgi:adenylate kinase family enzyme
VSNEVKPVREATHGTVPGRRIAVYGPTGSGKTTVSRRLGVLLDLPVIELDALFHKPEWEPTPEAEFAAKVSEALRSHPEGWVCDGNYHMIRHIVLPKAETVVWLRLPFPLVFWRLFKRTVTRAWTREPLWGTNYESWRQSFLSKDSILLWCVTHWRAHIRGVTESLQEVSHNPDVIVLRSMREVQAFLSSVRAHERPAT